MASNAFPVRPDLFTLRSKNPVTGKSFKLALDDLGSSLFIGPNEVMTVGGTWTLTRNAQGDISNNKSAAADTTYIVIPMRKLLKPTKQTEGMYNHLQAADRGIQINSIDVVYSIGTLALTSQTPTINKIVYANNAANAVSTWSTFTGTLATATQAQPYVSTLTLATQTFDQTADSDLNLEIAIVAQATSVYKFYGAFVNYLQNTM